MERGTQKLRAPHPVSSLAVGILAAMEMRTIADLEALLGQDSVAVADLKTLFSHAEAGTRRVSRVYSTLPPRIMASEHSCIRSRCAITCGDLLMHLSHDIRQARRVDEK